MRSALKHASTVRRGVARVAVARAAGLTAARLVAPTATAAGRVTATAHRTHQHRSFSTAAAPAGTTLVLADHDGGRLLESTSHVVSAARLLGGSEVVVLVLGNASAQSVADAAAAIAGVNKVIFVEDAQFERAIAEGQSTTIADIVKETKATHILASTSANGKNILPRLGAHLDVQPITEVIEVKSADTFVRPIYAGNAISTVQSADAIKVITVRPTSFERAVAADKTAPVSKQSSASVSASAGLSRWVSEELTVSARPSLSSARLVVAGGRGLKSKENFVIIEELADALGGAVGASRAAVDAGYVPNDYQVGQTGKVVAPDLYIAAGISGAIQHIAGMKDSKVIVAINKDKEAPIFQIADYGIEGDLFKIVPEMTNAIKAAKA